MIIKVCIEFNSDASLKAIKNVLISAMNEIDKKELAMAVARAVDAYRYPKLVINPTINKVNFIKNKLVIA